MDIYTELAESILAIKSDEELKKAFIKILEVGSYTQQVKVEKIRQAIEPLKPPAEVTHLIDFLRDDKVAHLVLAEITKD